MEAIVKMNSPCTWIALRSMQRASSNCLDRCGDTSNADHCINYFTSASLGAILSDEKVSRASDRGSNRAKGKRDG